MGEVAVERTGVQHFEPRDFQDNMPEDNQMDSQCQHPEQVERERIQIQEESNSDETSKLLERGYMQYGCSRYCRRCRIRAPCCNEIFDCRHCHNQAKNNIKVDRKLRHDMPRHQVSQVICSLCGTEQE
ncbi:hypothetical protein CRG98_006017, partial [Punica granatum]